MSRFKRHIFICENERAPNHPRGSCINNGAGRLRRAFHLALTARGVQSAIRVNTAGCTDACEFGPTIVVYPEGVWYGKVREEDVEEIVESHILGGNVVERLLIRGPGFTPETAISPAQKEM